MVFSAMQVGLDRFSTGLILAGNGRNARVFNERYSRTAMDSKRIDEAAE